MAPRKCSICNHPNRTEIEAQMVARPGVNAAIAEEWDGISKDGVRRHREHLSAALKTVATRRATRGAESALTQMERLRDRAETLLDKAEAAGSTKDALAAVRELRATIETLARLTGELDERPQVNILNVQQSQEWADLRGVLLEALSPFPDAAHAVAGRLLEIEQ